MMLKSKGSAQFSKLSWQEMVFENRQYKNFSCMLKTVWRNHLVQQNTLSLCLGQILYPMDCNISSYSNGHMILAILLTSKIVRALVRHPYSYFLHGSGAYHISHVVLVPIMVLDYQCTWEELGWIGPIYSPVCFAFKLSTNLRTNGGICFTGLNCQDWSISLQAINHWKY